MSERQNVRLELEDRAWLASLPPIPRSYCGASRPDSVEVDWHHTENQGPIGSCQGNDLTSCLERLQRVAGKTPVQLSRIFAYLATQKIDGLLGRDQGSTISGGVKLARDVGCPPEDMTGYPSSYPGSSERSRILRQECYDAGAPYKIESVWKVPEDPEQAKDWIGNGGAISIGIAWPGMPPGRVFVSYNGGSGGHALAILGYTTESLVGVNSHGDGRFEIRHDAWRSMMRHRYTAAIGMADELEPTPRPIKHVGRLA